ncbi:Neither inactivation nor afterpotential protein G [Danaus plexippus plexippus]|uniref:Neither inactivation nor afterpotential protein G n=2 Tax=Danaus plexippus TaxID=13037 RepID=A0A212F8K0_DANPL|nr:Neither inactivation nor afterpotential protein G [Danaus plexippus plexippus]QDQ16899.1 ninaG [Danaus plexippus]
MTLYTLFVSVLVVCVSYLVYQKYSNVNVSFVQKPEKRYDYIIVGAGTAGCVLASRLSEDPNVKVLLIEAGDHMGYFTKIPLTSTAAQLGPNDWSVRTTPQKYSSFGLIDRTQIIPRGRGPGGSGQINFLLHGFGLPEDYNRWSRLGFKGWTLENLKPYFIKAFGTYKSEFDSDMCPPKGQCSEAPMKLKLIDDSNELMTIFKQASLSLSDKTTLFRRATASIKGGSRYQTYSAYLKPALKRPNLHVLLKTQAISIRFEDQKVSSLYILEDHRNLDNIFVNKEIILSAGSIKTPQILMLSGIGPRNLMRRLRLELVSDNEFVGRNLHDHLNVPIYVSIKKPISITLAKVFSASTLWNYFWNGDGYLAFPPVAGVEYRNSSALMLFSMGSSSERLLRDLSNYKPQVFRETFPFHNDTSKEGFMWLASCVAPRSRGQVTVTDPSTSVPPEVDPNYLHREYDVRCIIRAIRRAERLVSTKSFRSIGAKIHWPRSERCLPLWTYTKLEQLGLRRRKKIKVPGEKPRKEIPKQKPRSPPDAYLECIIREVGVTGHHAGGTCAGGRVVDDLLRVKDVEGLRIMDASVFPAPTSLYPNSVIVAMAEKAADLIRNTVT